MRRIAALYPGVRADNPFMEIISSSLQEVGVEVFGWRDAPLEIGGTAFLLLNWIENQAVDPTTNLGLVADRRARRARKVGFRRRLQRIAELRSLGYRAVWVAHNRVPHSLRKQDFSKYAARTGPLWTVLDGVAHFTESSREDDAFRHLAHLPSKVLPHPHYELVAAEAHSQVAGRIHQLAFIGGFSPRKGAEKVIESVLRETDFAVLVTGDPPPGDKWRQLLEVSGGRLRVLPDPVSDCELKSVFDGRTAAVLCDYSQLNSGVAYFSLSRGAPVIAPKTLANAELASKFGLDWMRLYSGEDEASEIALAAENPVPTTLPDMSLHAPESTARALLAFVDELV